jgi:hypothetical protein
MLTISLTCLIFVSRAAQFMPSNTFRFCCVIIAAAFFNVLHPASGAMAREPEATWTSFHHKERGTIQINLQGKPFITYSYRDSRISRPYFANAYAPSGAKITRNHPPAADDPQDHDKMHPGMWLAFGDLSGADSWRLAAPIEHVRFVSQPRTTDDTLKFGVENRYKSNDGQREICREVCDYTLAKSPNGVVVYWDSKFRSGGDSFVFGDQEELGLGVRLAKSVAVKSGLGGRILNSNGQKNEKEAWGQQADWCDYSGPVGDEFVGIMIMPHSANFRTAWCHSRDTGFLAMNPFGRNAFTGKEKSAIVVQANHPFRLRYAVLFHWNDRPQDFNPQHAYREYLQSTRN